MTKPRTSSKKDGALAELGDRMRETNAFVQLEVRADGFTAHAHVTRRVGAVIVSRAYSADGGDLQETVASLLGKLA